MYLPTAGFVLLAPLPPQAASVSAITSARSSAVSFFMLFITVPPVFTVFSYCFFLSECAYIGTSHLRRLPHSGQYAGVEAPGLGCQPQVSQVSGFAKPQPVQKLPSFSARQAWQLHAADGSVCGS